MSDFAFVAYHDYALSNDCVSLRDGQEVDESEWPVDLKLSD